MEIDPRNGMEILDEAQCHALLAGGEVGRLAVAPGGRPEIFPVNYLFHQGQVVFRTAEGSKLSSVAVNQAVAFEIDGYEPESREAWSVVVVGVARMVTSEDETILMESLPLRSWNVGPKDHFVEIGPQRVSGRRFVALGKLDDQIAGRRPQH